MDDLYALDGGGAATAWQKRHQKRKAREAAAQLRRQLKAEAKADLAKRTKRWRVKWNAQAAANKAAGLPPPSTHGRPRDINSKKHNLVDETGNRYGRLTVIRIAPISKSQGRNRRWVVKCDCGTGERLISGTVLRQGNSKSCGCLRSERVRESWKVGNLAKMQTRRALERAKPLSYHLLKFRHRFKSGSKEAKLLIEARKLVMWAEVQRGIIRPRRSRKAAGSPDTTVH
jgi:hypothetical protein